MRCELIIHKQCLRLNRQLVRSVLFACVGMIFACARAQASFKRMRKNGNLWTIARQMRIKYIASSNGNTLRRIRAQFIAQRIDAISSNIKLISLLSAEYKSIQFIFSCPLLRLVCATRLKIINFLNAPNAPIGLV